MNGRYDRKGFLALGGGLGIGALLSACGGGEGGDSSSTAAGSSTAATEPAPAFDAASESGPIKIFEWAGYEAKEMWADYLKGPYAKDSPLKFTFLDNDQQALAKVASGYSPDIIHPCIAYTKDWAAAGLIQPWDTTLLPDFAGIPTNVSAGGVIDGKQYHVPFDIGFSSLVYRADKIKPDEESWNVLLDDRYKGKLSFFSDDVAIIKVGALIAAGAPIDPNVLTTEQIQGAKEAMIQAKGNLRNFWDAQADTINDFVNGNVWATYVWPDGYWKIKNHPKMKDVPIEYMWPKEGRLAWVCGFVLNAETKVPGRAHAAVAAANTPQVAAWLTDAFQYGAAQQDGVTALIKDKALIKAFSLDDSSAFAPPRSWFEAPLPNRKEYVDAAAEVKAS